MKVGDVKYAEEVQFGAWGRNGRVRQSGLTATILGDEIVLEPITSRNMTSTAVQLRIPLRDRAAVIDMLNSLD